MVVPSNHTSRNGDVVKVRIENNKLVILDNHEPDALTESTPPTATLVDDVD
jgi:hypothetical protein